MSSVHLRIDGVSKSFGGTEVLKNVSIDIERGEFATFLGPSGCGKTTLLRSIAGFYSVDSGRIILNGQVMNDLPSHLRKAVMVFQDYALFPHMTVRDNICYGLKLRKLDKSAIGDRLERTTSYLDLAGLLERYPSQISGGQQQRVALARALIMEPEVLLLDEPLSNLDAKLRMSIRSELRKLQQKLKITTIYVTHDQGEALALSDKIAVMSKGEMLQIDSPTNVYFRPDKAFVADFIGTTNIFEGRWANEDRRAARLDDGSLLEVSDRYRGLDRETLRLCIRPEMLRIAPPGEGGGPNRLRGKIESHIFEGSYIRYWIDVGGKTIVADDHDPGEKDCFEGEVVVLLDRERLHVF